MKHILVPTDFSKRSMIAAERAFHLAARAGARVTMLHVVDEDLPRSMIEAAEREAADLFSASATARPGVKIETRVLVGEPSVEIANFAADNTVDLVVVGAHRRTPLRDAFLGTTAERAIRALRVPALIVRKASEGRYRKPIVALDLAHDDVEPWNRAAALEIFDIETATAVFTYEAGTYHLLRKANADVKDFEHYFAEERKKVLPSVSAAMKKIGLAPEQAHLTPIVFSTADTICDVATRKNGDLIIVGARRKTALDRFMLGGVSIGVLRRADIDVLVTPPG
jgi:nucleotide-binding universal stress UspA family protein